VKLGILKRLLSGLGSQKSSRLEPVANLQRVLGYNFTNLKLLQTALTHRSALQEGGSDDIQSNERLEFLGDAILDMVVVEHLYRHYPDRREGELSKIKSMLVNGKSLHLIAMDLGLGEYIHMSENEARNGGRTRVSILEDTMEAIIAALYLDGGLQTARQFIDSKILCDLDELVNGDYDHNYKSQLLEYAQGLGMETPVYRVIREMGPDHKKKFEVEVLLEGRSVGVGVGSTKKNAQQRAAREALKLLSIQECRPQTV